ncbi:MAG: type II secretion system major pseudopilin GspG [Myxococcota bacterium]
MSRRDTKSKRDARRSGFTLIEIMAVVMIMGMLMGLLAYGINDRIQVARREMAKGQVARIEQALDFYQLDNARYPTADQGLQALVSRPSAPPEPRNYNPAGYIKPDGLEDPWGEAFRYRIPGEHNPGGVDIWSLGPDTQEGTEDDITNWSAVRNG